MCLSEQTINDLCEAFEEQWSRDNGGPDGLTTFLTTNHCIEPFDQHLLSTLIIVDIERSWLSWHNFLRQLSANCIEQVSTAEVLKRFASLPTLDSYRELVCVDSMDKDLKSEILQYETRARAQWGDAIGPEFYRKCHGIETSVGASCPIRHVLISDCELTSEAEAVRFPIRGLNRLGRQRSFDPQPLICEQLVEGNRITITDDQNLQVSRNQLTIQLLNPGFVAITNTGRKNSVISNHLEDYPQGEPVLQALPLDLKLARCRLRIR